MTTSGTAQPELIGATYFGQRCCFLTLGLSLVFLWARDVTENAMKLIPYIGFFGTLLGMGAALAILGQANLSDPVSKAINLVTDHPNGSTHDRRNGAT